MGFIGLGNRGDQVLDAFLTHPDAEIVALGDLSPAYMDFGAHKIGGSPRQFRALIEIIISSPRLQLEVPFAVELIGTELQFMHLRPGDFSAGLVRA